MAYSFLRSGLFRNHLKRSVVKQRRTAGYLVLIPEIGEDAGDKNALLTNDGLPEFNDITIEKCIACIGQQAIDYERSIKQIEEIADKTSNIFVEIFQPLEHQESKLELTWGLAKTLYLGNSCLMPTKSYMQIHERAHQARSSKFTSYPIYKAVLEEQKRNSNLTEEQSRLLSKYSIEGNLNGLNVFGVKKERLIIVLNEMQKEKKIFRDKVDVATKKFSHTIEDPEIVREFPETLLKAMAVDSSDAGTGPWNVTLQPHIYNSFLEHCPSKTLRWNAWQAYTRRCSGYAETELETSIHLEKIRMHRREQANILGYDNFVDMSMQTKMVKSLKNLKEVFSTLRERARPFQDSELELLEDFAKDNGFEGNLDYCDIPYWQRKQKQLLFNFDEEKIREFFPLPKVMAGLFELCTYLFNIAIIERSNVHTWHKDVKFYDIVDSDAKILAGFYFDPYAREDEKIRVYDDIGWHIAIRNKCTYTNTTPLSALIFNFQVPLYGKPSLLSFNEVTTLFQRFGHALRHLLTRANYSDVAGNSFIEWDAAEVCGHVMTHWLYDPETIQTVSGHYTSGEPLPDNVIKNLKLVRGHMAGYNLCKELYLADLDLELHSTKEFWRDIVRRIWPTYFTLPFDKYDSHPCSFTKVFSEEWGAAYFCHLWSQMIAADIYSAFNEATASGKDVTMVGKRYRDTFLALGGGCHPSEVFRRFRGRDPSPNALLHNMRLKKMLEQE